MYSLARLTRCFVLIASMLMSVQFAWADVPSGMPKFIGALLQKHSYLLEPHEREFVDQLNRQFREGEHKRRNGRDDTEKQVGVEQMNLAAREFLRIVGDMDLSIHVTLEKDKAVPSIIGPHPMPGDRGAVLLRVEDGQGEARFIAIEIDLAEKSGDIKIDCVPQGITYALVGLNHLPVERSTLSVEFQRGHLDPVKALMAVRAPGSGQLSLAVLSDDSGEPTPAMVRLTSLRDNRDRKPTNAVDLTPQFDNQGPTTGHRRARLPGKLGGDWWIVPEPFNMALTPGDYEVAIRRGAEHVPLFDTIRVHSGEATERTYRPKRWVDMRQAGWYSGDDHVHCQILSDGDARRLMAWSQAEDVHVVNVVKMGDVFRTFFEQRGFGEDYRVIDYDYVLSPGQECPRTHGQLGHTLAMATTSMVRDTDNYFLYDWVADTVHDQGGLFGFAHVGEGAFHVHRGLTLWVPQMMVDFAEVLQMAELGTDLWYEFLDLGFKMTASAGSDVPWGGTIGEVRMFAFIGNEPFSADAWFEAVRKGRTFVTDGPMLELSVDDAMPGDEINVEPGHRLTVRARTWGHPERADPERLEIVRHGEVIHTAYSDDKNADQIIVGVEVGAGHGCWLAARAYAANGTKAHTTPVYVTTGGLRFWNYGRVEELLAKRTESLNQVEHIIATAKRQLESGDIDAHQTFRQLALQGNALLERVKIARNIYHELHESAERERVIRKGTIDSKRHARPYADREPAVQK